MTKRTLLTAVGAMLCLLPFTSKAQTYSAWGQAINQNNAMYHNFTTAGDSLKFSFQNTQTVAYGQPKLIVYYEGNFANGNDYMDIYDETLNYFSSTDYGQYDCGPEDSTVFYINPADINTWAAGNSIVFTLIPNSGAGFCIVNRVRARLVYDYCLSGPPAQYATPAVSNAFMCSTDAPYNLTGIPAGGVFSGIGVTGTTFSPANLASGSYMISYTATDSQTCTTTGKISVYVKPSPVVNNNVAIYACQGAPVTLEAAVGNSFTWYSDAALSSSVSASDSYTTPVLTQTTSYWVAASDKDNNLTSIAVSSASFAIVDVNNIAGDDRGGIAVTQTHIYLNGDDNAVRYDLDLTPSTAVALPIRDGMFSDLRSGKLWSLWNTNNPLQINASSDYNVNALRGMDADLRFTNEYIYLSETINMESDNANSGIFAGSGKLGLYSGTTQHWYVIDMDNGGVADLGYLQDPELRSSENWASWGILESSCSNVYSVIYRDYNDDNIHRRILPDGAVTTAGSFSGISDMASLTYSPWNSRWYWHYESSSSTFGGSRETLGYANATANTSVCAGSGLSCPAKVTVNVPAAVTFTMPENIVCLSNDATLLTGGAPAGGTYAGIGVGTGTSGTVFYPALAGTGTHSISYIYTDSESGCTDTGMRAVTVDICTGIAAQTTAGGISIYPNPCNGNFSFTADADMSTVQIEVADIQGRVVYTAQVSDMAAGAVKQADLTAMPAGMYLVKIINGTRQQVQRLVIAH